MKSPTTKQLLAEIETLKARISLLEARPITIYVQNPPPPPHELGVPTWGQPIWPNSPHIPIYDAGSSLPLGMHAINAGATGTEGSFLLNAENVVRFKNS